MKPTQAQLKAAMDTVGDCPITGTEMLAALTAAAQVGEQDEIVRVASMIPNTINATIERCAQVAEGNWLGEWQLAGRDIAAAIRKLKEQP